MSAAPASATLFDWERHQAVASLEARRQALIAKLAEVRPRSERFFVLRMKLRELTEEELRLSCGGADV